MTPDPAEPIPGTVLVGPPRLPCRHLGPSTGETVECPTCSGRVQLKLFACAVHGTCTPGKAAPGVANCLGCDSYTPAE